MAEMFDAQKAHVQVEIDRDVAGRGETVRVNVDGVCVARITSIASIEIVDKIDETRTYRAPKS